MESIFELRSVGVRLGGQPILEDINLVVSPGEAVAIVGPNGSGKTTLLRLVATLIRPATGDGAILGQGLLGAGVRDIRPHIGLISHQPALLDELTLEENLTHFARLSGVESTSVERALTVVGLDRAGNRRGAASSYGMKRRVEVAWLLISKPKLLLLDEAKSGLDGPAQELIDALVNLTIERGGAIASVSHDRQHLAGSQFKATYQIDNGRLRPNA